MKIKKSFRAIIIIIVVIIAYGMVNRYGYLINPVFSVERLLGGDYNNVDKSIKAQIDGFNRSSVVYGMPEVAYDSDVDVRTKVDSIRLYKYLSKNKTQLTQIEGPNSFRKLAHVKVSVLFYEPYNHEEDIEGYMDLTMERHLLRWKIVGVKRHDIRED